MRADSIKFVVSVKSIVCSKQLSVAVSSNIIKDNSRARNKNTCVTFTC